MDTTIAAAPRQTDDERPAVQGGARTDRRRRGGIWSAAAVAALVAAVVTLPLAYWAPATEQRRSRCRRRSCSRVARRTERWPRSRRR